MRGRLIGPNTTNRVPDESPRESVCRSRLRPNPANSTPHDSLGRALDGQEPFRPSCRQSTPGLNGSKTPEALDSSGWCVNEYFVGAKMGSGSPQWRPGRLPNTGPPLVIGPTGTGQRERWLPGSANNPGFPTTSRNNAFSVAYEALSGGPDVWRKPGTGRELSAQRRTTSHEELCR